MRKVSAVPIAATMPLPVVAAPLSKIFSEEELREHRLLRTPLWDYFLQSRLLVLVVSPLIYGCAIPFVLLDIFISVYQAVCFPVYGIPKVRRSDYLIFDRAKLQYLNACEKVNCFYCSYANGLTAYVAKIAGRTEQHWCPIEHARESAARHSRYRHFLPYGNAVRYQQ